MAPSEDVTMALGISRGATLYLDDFDPTTATRDEILARAGKLRGLRLREVPGFRARERAAGDKGSVGQYIERYFNIRQNSDSQPDFSGAGIELKVVPLKLAGTRPKAFRSKERTSVSMINYGKLLDETWATATIRSKCSSILFVFYHHLPDGDVPEFPIMDVAEWSPDAQLLAQFSRDWAAVHAKVSDGRAHEISESDGKVLGAATKGAAGARVSQPRSPIKARPRCWALKPALTTSFYADLTSRRAKVSVADHLGLSAASDFERETLRRLHEYAGIELGELSSRLGVPLSAGKANAAVLVRRLLGLVDDRARLKEFEQEGILVKTVPISEDGKRAFESMSFPNFRHMEVIKETWEDSDLHSYLQRLLIVPLVRRYREEPRSENRIGRAFFWSPSDDEIDEISREWQMYVALIAAKRADKLPTARETHYIHVRPKGRDSSDTEPAPGFAAMMKRCFWLNARYVERIVTEALPSGVLD